MNKIIKEFRAVHFENMLEAGSLSFTFAVIILILIPLYIWFIPPFMVLWGIIWILENRKKKIHFHSENRFPVFLFFLFIAFYLWQLAGILYSDDTNTGWNTFLSRLSLFLFPLVLLIPGEKIKKNGISLLKIFAGSTTLFIIICFGYALYNSISFQNGVFLFNPHPAKEYWMNYFYGFYFSVNQHPSYLAMYVIMSGFISFESWFNTSLRMKKRIGWLVNGIFLMISLYFLSSRSGLLAVVVLIPVYLFFKVYKRKKLITGFAILVLLSILFFVVRTNERVSIGMGEISKESFFQRDGRISIWESALHTIRHNLILGVGIGDVKTELMKEYQRRGDQNLIENHYNVHNQYLEILLENGIIGLTFFLSILVVMFYFAFSERNVLYSLFIIMMVIFFLFETVLNRLQGVTFFSLFSFLLIHINNNNQIMPVDIQKQEE